MSPIPAKFRYACPSPLIPQPRPSAFLPAGQLADAIFWVDESNGEAPVAMVRPGSGLAQIAYAVTDQPPL